MKNNIEAKELVALLEVVMPKVRHLRDFRSVMLQKSGESEKALMYRRSALSPDDLRPEDHDPIVSRWGRNEKDELRDKIRELKGEVPHKRLRESTYPRKGDMEKMFPGGIPQPMKMGTPGPDGMPGSLSPVDQAWNKFGTGLNKARRKGPK